MERSTSATDLAKFATCERQAYLDKRYPHTKDSRAIQASKTRGNYIHALAERQGHPASHSDRRCFIATAVFGQDAEETNSLRTWRDRNLLPHHIGRLLVSLYYRLSPCVADYLERHPAASRATAALLRSWIRRIR
jgi:hypothetical protein